MVEELDVVRMVFCPYDEEMVDCEDCTGCAYYHDMGDNNFTLKCGFLEKEKNEEHKNDEDGK